VIRRGDPFHDAYNGPWRRDLEGITLRIVDNVPLDRRRHDGKQAALGVTLGDVITILQPDHPLRDDETSTFSRTLLHELGHIDYSLAHPNQRYPVDARYPDEHEWIKDRVQRMLGRLELYGGVLQP